MLKKVHVTFSKNSRFKTSG